MGDLIMSGPAIRALKESFGANITVLTSSMAADIVKHIPEIDDVIIYDLPWVKTAETPNTDDFKKVVAEVRDRQFDAAVIFTVYSQNPLPTAMLAYLAGIPKILAYCRENPYHLITDWVPDKEPYSFIKHQVERDLNLVRSVGAETNDHKLSLTVNNSLWFSVSKKLYDTGIDTGKAWLIAHAGVSEIKRQYPNKLWTSAIKKLVNERGYQVLLTGSKPEKKLTDELQQLAGEGSFSIAGMFSIDEFICLVKHAPLLVSVNTGTIHIAAAVGTPVVVLYAQTNPQHTPWQVPSVVLPFPVAAPYRSKNEVIAYVNQTVYSKPCSVPDADDIIKAIDSLINLQGLPIQPFREIPNQNQATAAS